MAQSLVHNPQPGRRASREPARGQRQTRRVLFVSYPFPPVGGAGVQRTTKFVKYLRDYGWQASVLTAANPSVPLFDDSLLSDIPAGTVVRRARTLEPGYATKMAVSAGGGAARRPGLLRRLVKSLALRLGNLVLQPDAQVLWVPGAVREGMRLLGETQHDAIVVSGPPFSSFLVGAALSRRTGLPLVLDYRDEWDLSNAYWENKRLGPLSRCVQRQMQHRVVRQASALVATTRSSALALEAIRRRAGSSARVTWIYNGYDPEDFSGPLPSPAAPGGSFRLVYVGTLWEMTSVAPLVNAVSRLARHAPGQAGALELVFAGRRTAPQQQVIEGLRGLPCRVVEQPYVDHDKAVALLRSADALCALLSDLPGVGRVVPAKIFEYLAARKPVLTIAPRGDLWDLLEGCPRAARFLPADDEGVAGWLEAQIRGRAAGAVFDDGEWEGSRFNRKHQAGQLATLLEGLC